MCNLRAEMPVFFNKQMCGGGVSILTVPAKHDRKSILKMEE